MPFDALPVVETFKDLMDQKRSEEALEVLQRALRENPEVAAFHYQYGRFHEAEIKKLNFWDTNAIKAKRADALKCYMHAMRLDATSHKYPFVVAVTARKMGLKNGKGFIQQAIRLKPDEANYWREFGKQCAALGEHAAAEKHFKRALEMNLEDHVSWFDYATNQIALGRARIAKYSLENAQKLLAGKDRDFDRRITETLKKVYKMPPERRDSRGIPAGIPSMPAYS